MNRFGDFFLDQLAEVLLDLSPELPRYSRCDSDPDFWIYPIEIPTGGFKSRADRHENEFEHLKRVLAPCSAYASITDTADLIRADPNPPTFVVSPDRLTDAHHHSSGRICSITVGAPGDHTSEDKVLVEVSLV